ncbi:MAG: nuclear transport factor 2 family protein [Acidobacteriota bacterium]|jgi:hypothetical protein
MAIQKPESVPANSPERQNGRRSFLRKTGVAASALLASAAAGLAKSTSNESVDAVDSKALLEENNAVRRLQQAYESHLHEGRHEEILNLFAVGAEAVFNNGLFAGRKGIRRLYCGLFNQGQTGRKIEPAPGYELNPTQQQDTVDIAPDRQSAIGYFPYSIQVGSPMTPDSSLVEMARLHGEGIRKWWEGGIQQVRYVKEGSEWKIRRIEYQSLSKADYRPGKLHARSIEIPAFDRTYPADPTGPDRIL